MLYSQLLIIPQLPRWGAQVIMHCTALVIAISPPSPSGFPPLHPLEQPTERPRLLYPHGHNISSTGAWNHISLELNALPETANRFRDANPEEICS